MPICDITDNLPFVVMFWTVSLAGTHETLHSTIFNLRPYLNQHLPAALYISLPTKDMKKGNLVNPFAPVCFQHGVELLYKQLFWFVLYIQICLFVSGLANITFVCVLPINMNFYHAHIFVIAYMDGYRYWRIVIMYSYGALRFLSK